MRVCGGDGPMQLGYQCPACRACLVVCDDCDRLETPGYDTPIKPLLAAAKPFEHVASVRCCDDPGCNRRVVLVHSPCRPGGCYDCHKSTIRVVE